MIDMKVTFNNVSSKELTKLQKELKKIPQDAYQFFVAQTPIRSGNARRSTSLSNNTIVADYPYAQRLDDGYSTQAPRGMVKPTEAFVNRQVKKLTGK
jgi:hypothetical protein